MTEVGEAGVPTAQTGWRRMDLRMLVINPVRIFGQMAVPAVAGAVGFGSIGSLAAVVVIPLLALLAAVVFGALQWWATAFALDDRQLRLRQGLVGRRETTVTLDRVRSVDIEAPLIHRLLGLARVTVGTGVDAERISLDALSAEESRRLRAWLLTRRTTAAAVATGEPTPDQADAQATDQATLAEPEQRIAELDWSWVRYAPFSLSRLAVVAAALGFLSQFVDDVGIDPTALAESSWEALRQLGLVVAIVSVAVGLPLVWVVISVVGYALQWGGLVVSRDRSGRVPALQVRAGLITTRSTTVEEPRIRGVELIEPVLLRLVGGAELTALATGVGAGGTARVLPPCPRAVAVRVAGDVAGVTAPLDVPLRRHGFLARRRRHVRAGLAALPLVGALVALDLVDVGPPWWLGAAVVVLAAAGLAESSYRHLGHALTPDHLVAGHGLLSRRRTVLERDGIIGWVVQQSWFQRRVGLATLVATTAAGRESVAIVDLPRDAAVALADAATPAMLTPFRGAA